MRSAQRCLFERPSDQDRQLEMEKLEARMKEVVDMKSKQYNFDFSTCQPIPGDSYEWEKVAQKSRRHGKQSRSLPHVNCEERCEPFRQINAQHSKQHQQQQQQQQQQQSTTDLLVQTAAIATGVTDHTRLQEVQDAVAGDLGDISDVPKVKNLIENIQKKKAASLESLVSQKLLRKRSSMTG